MRLPARLSRRKADSHKGDYGHVLILAGSVRYSGAALLAAWGCLRSGAGLVTLGVPKRLAAAMIRRKPMDAMLLPLADTPSGMLSIRAFAQIAGFDADVILAGPGLSWDGSTNGLVRKVVGEIFKPMVLDASALDAFAGKRRLLKRRAGSPACVVTPHPGEMSRLTGIPVSAVQINRKGIAKNFANEYNVTVVLKGNNSVVASPDGRIFVNKTGNPGMARGGTGDILGGIIAAFIGQGLEAFEAAKYAVYLHGLAGDIAAREKTQLGMTASDLMDALPKAIRASL